MWKESKLRLLDADLFVAIARVLKADGQLIIVTDDETVCTNSVTELSYMPHLFTHTREEDDDSDSDAVVPDPAMAAAEKKRVGYTRAVPHGYGTSYFDRLWTAGKRKKRYFLRYTSLYRAPVAQPEKHFLDSDSDSD